MPQTVAELLDAAMTLSESERAELAELLAATVDAPAGRLHPAWATEIRRRSAEVESGAVRPVSLAESLKRVEQVLVEGGPSHG